MKRIIKLIIWILVIGGGILWWKYTQFQNAPLVTEESIIEINGGGFQSALTQAWASPLFTKYYLSRNTPNFQLQKGRYIIPANATITIYIESLRTPLNESDEFITFLEGWNIYDIDKTLSERWLIEAGDFSNFATDCEQFCPLKAEYSFIADASTLEGFLYPDTYAINPTNFTIESLTRKMLDNFKGKVIDSGIISDMGSIEILDVINMASIVQKEANKQDNPEEMAIIAGILKKRLEEGWMIGADATVCYAHEIATQDCTPAEVLEYLYEVNWYNTRQMIWLPETPISNPEAEVIDATLNSIDSEYYYYLHDTTGQIHYGITGADHEANKNAYLR